MDTILLERMVVAQERMCDTLERIERLLLLALEDQCNEEEEDEGRPRPAGQSLG